MLLIGGNSIPARIVQSLRSFQCLVSYIKSDLGKEKFASVSCEAQSKGIFKRLTF